MVLIADNHEFSDETVANLCDTFRGYLPEIDNFNAGRQLADLFISILKAAAGTKRKSPVPVENDTEPLSGHDQLKEKVLTSGTGYDRLRAVLEKITSTTLTKSALVNIIGLISNLEKKGICHMLVNDERIRSWVVIDDGTV